MNSLTGPIPSDVGLLTNLSKFGASFRSLFGRNLVLTPSSNLILYTTVTLRLYDNALTGSVPSEIGHMTSLSELYCHIHPLLHFVCYAHFEIP